MITTENPKPGFSLSFGVFQDYYSTHQPFSSEPSNIPVISTTATVSGLPANLESI
jgi:hypothetical protein